MEFLAWLFCTGVMALILWPLPFWRFCVALLLFHIAMLFGAVAVADVEEVLKNVPPAVYTIRT